MHSESAVFKQIVKKVMKKVLIHANTQLVTKAHVIWCSWPHKTSTHTQTYPMHTYTSYPMRPVQLPCNLHPHIQGNNNKPPSNPDPPPLILEMERIYRGLSQHGIGSVFSLQIITICPLHSPWPFKTIHIPLVTVH